MCPTRHQITQKLQKKHKKFGGYNKNHYLCTRFFTKHTEIR